MERKKNKFYKNKKLRKLGLILLVIGFISVVYWYVLFSTTPVVTADEAYEMFDARYIDVRPFGEFNVSHIRTALSYPYAECSDCFKNRVGKLDKDETYIVYCNTGSTSKGAVDYMRSVGFTDVYSLEGGFDVWVLKDYHRWENTK